MLFEGKRIRPFSAEHAADLAALERMVLEMDARLRSVSSPPDIGNAIKVRVTGGSSNSSTAPIWTYSGAQVEQLSATGTAADYGTLSGGATFTLTLINDLEQGNTSVLAYGLAVAWDSGSSSWLLSTSPFTGNTFNRVPNGTVVTVLVEERPDGTLRGSFSAPNWILPGCEA